MVTSSRLAAARALHAVFGEGRRLPEAWDEGLGPQDAALAQALLGLALRNWGRLGAYARKRLKDPGRGVPLGSEVALALGLAQLAWMDGVAAFAAVNESVELVAHRDLGFAPHRGLVNAILRRAAEDPAALRTELDALPLKLDRSAFAEKVLRAALAPRGQEDRADALWRLLRTPARADFRALKEGPLPEGLEEIGEVTGCLRLAEGAAFPGPWLASGAGMVQDRSSQALLSFPWDRPVRRILDACAAPGGKTTFLARRWPEATILALEQNPRRAERLKENLARRDVEAQVVVAEAAAWMAEGGKGFDLILLDAPCSGSGTLRKHPELNWIGGELDLVQLQRRQRALLQAALPRLAPGGLLIYAVCSWLPEEAEAHLRWAREAHPDLEPAAVWPAGFGTEPGPTACFLPDPLDWEGEGFQAFALGRPI
jgi:16S rRNA (cytosine967-C5)-methyltransferase